MLTYPLPRGAAWWLRAEDLPFARCVTKGADNSKEVTVRFVMELGGVEREQVW